ncbi:MAG TPA: recombinase family protein [Caproicibacter sp.]|nr:recombinase family protein [Caproicibacter sp.]
MQNEKKEIVTLLPKPLIKKSKRIAAYCRVSSQQDEQLHSLAAQVTYYENLLSQDDDCEFAGIYADTGISGTRTTNRAQFLQLIEDCRVGKVDGIITKSVSRFGRNTVDTLVFTRELRRYGIDVFFEKENLHSCSPEGELLLTLMAALAESEAVSMSDNIKWGKRRRFEKGLVGSLAINNIYGYCKINGEVAINEQEATIVRRIFKEFVDGFNYNEITDGLLSDGITTRRPGASWAVTTIKNIISNEKYCGDCRFQKTFIQNPISHKRVPNHGELPQFLVEDCLPAIVDRETWSVAQEMRKRHTQESKPPCKEYPFRGMMFCGVCGKPVNQQYTTREGRRLTATFRCISRVDCSGMEIPGLTYTPPHKSTYTKNPTDALVEYREKYCKKVPPRPLCCSDIRIPVERPQKAFVQAWNLIVSKKIRYQSTLQRTAATTDAALMRYRANEMLSLVNTIGKIAEFDYSLMLRTLDRVETTSDDRLTFLFQSGIRITV